MTAIKFILFLLVAGLAVYWAWPKRLKGRVGVSDTLELSPARIAIGVAVIITLLATYPAVGLINAGQRGVVLQFGAVTGRTLGEGFYVVTPFMQEVEVMTVQTQAYSVPAEAASQDLQTVDTKITLNYSLDPVQVGEVYRRLRRDYERIVIVPAVQEAVKAATARFTAEQLITQRPLIKEAIEVGLRDRLAKHGILVDTISITDFEFSKSFNEAIEAKVTATQKALEAERNLQRVKFEAEQVVARAQAEATSIRIQGEALRQNPELVSLRWVEKWNGQLPETMLSGGVVPFIDLNQKK